MPQTHKENQEGLNEGYYSHCSFRSPTQAVPAEINPRSVLNRLFNKQEQGAGRRESSADERSGSTDVGSGPRRRQGPAADIARNTTSTSWMNTWTACARWNAASPPSNIARRRRRWRRPASARANATPPIPRRSRSRFPEGDKRSEYMQVMCDLNVLAFQTDTTRVSTYIGSTPNGVSYPELGFNDTASLPDPSQQRAGEGREGRRDHRLQHRPVRLHGEEDAQPARRRRHPARQLHHDVGLRPRGRQQAHPRKPSLHHRRQRRRLDQHGTFPRRIPRAIRATCSPRCSPAPAFRSTGPSASRRSNSRKSRPSQESTTARHRTPIPPAPTGSRISYGRGWSLERAACG